MNKNLFFLILGFPLILSAQQYSVGLIPDSLKNHADVVTRMTEVIYEIKSPSRAIEHEHHIYTILNESADYLGEYRTHYGSFNNIQFVSGNLYDEAGKKIRHFKTGDMSDHNYNDGFSLMNSERYKEYDFFNRSYPYTVDFEEEDEISGILHIGNWVPQGFNQASVELTRFVVIAPKDYPLRYKSENFFFKPEIREQGEKKIYTWEMKNLPAKRNLAAEPFSFSIYPFVIIAPSDFEAQGYKGNMNSWESYGRFIYELKKGRDELPPDVKRKVHDLTDTLSSGKQKINVLYNYLQQNTHYISIQLGIGGWQPFDAIYVGSKGYGDCKALSNFMIALLKEAGIIGKYVIIRSGEEAIPINTGFPSFQFDHVIVCVPQGKDTTWLECTSQTLPAGYLSGFTADRDALLVDENGGKLVHTPAYTLKDNLQSRKIDASLGPEGNLLAKVSTRYVAERQDRLELWIAEYERDKLLTEVKNAIELPSYDIQDFSYRMKKDIIPEIDESMALNANNYAQVSGRRLFIIPNILNRFDHRLKTAEERQYSIRLKNAYRDIDSVQINIPSGYKPESVPQDISIDSRFGRYHTSIKLQPAKIFYYREWEQFNGIFPPADYDDLVKYYDQIYKADRGKIVFVKEE